MDKVESPPAAPEAVDEEESKPVEPAPPPATAQAPPQPEEEEKKRRRLEGIIPDIVRRTFYAGLGAVFTTEEGIRKLASEFHLPKDVAAYLIQQAATSKDELFRIVAKELRGFLESVNVSGELQKLLTSLSFEVKTEIRFIPNDQSLGGVKPEIKLPRMQVKRGEKDKGRGLPPEDEKKSDAG